MKKLSSLAVAVLCLASVAQGAPSLHWLPDGFQASEISDSGSVIAGTYWRWSRTDPAIWTQDAGLTLLDLGWWEGGQGVSGANAISADGRIVAGGVGSFDKYSSTLWIDGRFVDLGNVPNHMEHSLILKLSADGRVAVGVTDRLDGMQDIAIWRNQTLERVIEHSAPFAASNDGGRIGGSDGTFPLLWSEAEGRTVIADHGSGYVAALSGDGHYAFMATWDGPFRWASGAFESLGSLPGKDYIQPQATNIEGNIAFGTASYKDLNHRAWIWRKGQGLVFLDDYLVEQGANAWDWESVYDGTLSGIYDITPDGRTLLGYSIDQFGDKHSWVVTGVVTAIPEPAATVAVAVLLALTLCFARTVMRNQGNRRSV